MAEPNANTKPSLLDKFGTDITYLAEQELLEKIVGRQVELNRMCQILCRKKKNNPILIGEPGCVDGETIITIKKISNDTIHENVEIDY